MRTTEPGRWVLLSLAFVIGCADPHANAVIDRHVGAPEPTQPAPREAVARELELADDTHHSATSAHADALELSFVGDVVLGRYLQQQGTPERFVPLYADGGDPFADVHGLLAADLIVGNLESPLAREVPGTAALERRSRFAGGPAQVDQLTRAGFDVLSLANNHFFDLGRAGQLDGPQLLADAGILAIGSARAEPPLLRIETLELHGWRIGFLAFTTVRNHNGPSDGPHLPHVSLIDLREQAEPLLEAARDDHDLLIVVAHWGTEYAAEVGRSQRLAAHGLLHAGADLLIGHHPHVLQAIERHRSGDARDGLIAYSLGNFLFPRNDADTELGAVLRVRYVAASSAASPGDRPCLERARVHPLTMLRKPGWHPAPATGHRAVQVRRRITELSRKHGTRMRASDDGEDLWVDGLRACATE